MENNHFHNKALIFASSHKKKPLKPLLIATLTALLTAQHTFADPWVSPGDERTRHHIQVLADSGKVKLPTSTWPMMWSGVAAALDKVRIEDLTDQELWSYRYIKHELRRAQKKLSAQKTTYISNSHPTLTNFASDSREKSTISVSATGLTDHFAVKIQGNAVQEPSDDDKYRMDGSYAAVTAGNWVLGLGAIDRWWGPGWQNSLILSNNARPAPGLFLKRNQSKAFSWPVLKWFGPWDIELFGNQLESDRHIKDAKLLGGRLTLKPLKSFEIGLVRTAQWGGEERPQDLDSLWNLVVGQDNKGEGGIAEDGTNEPGNQLAGYDWRYNFSFFGINWAIYQQRIGEDEKDYMPFQSIDFWGSEVSFSTTHTNNRLSVEYTDTATHALKSEGKGNVVYEHSIYQSGYRYHGRSLGAAVDNDSRMVSLNGFHELSSGQTLYWTFAKVESNRDSSNRTSPGGSNFSPAGVDYNFAEIELKLPITDNSQIGVGGSYVDEKIGLLDQATESKVHASLNIRF